jgi:hypothetical protein
MKRLSFITLCLVAITLTAKAQVVPHYAETYEERPGGKLLNKMWVSADGNYRQESTDESGTFINIFRRDSMAVYRLDPAKKTCLVIKWSQISDPNKMFGAKMTESENTKAEFIRTENVEGYECEYWKYTTTTKMSNGQSQTTYYHQWIYKPLNTWIRQSVNPYGNSPREIKRNIRQGAQSASLFTIPKDYKRTAMPGGGILEMMSGKSQEQTRQKTDEFKQKQQESNKSVEDALDPNKSQEQQINDVMKLIEGTKKKK